MISSSVNDTVCQQIADALPGSIFYPGTDAYDVDVSHYAVSSAQQALCSVRPSTADDIGITLGIVAANKTPFAVKGGGFAMNPGSSSTPGVHISMAQFSEVTYDATLQTVVIGAGLVWDQVYEALAPYGVNVLGARGKGVGVAGFILGGGYSWKSNQYGLAFDTVVAFELVKPDGTIINVTATSDSELFFGLKGGFNNFGIVTRFTLKTYPQDRVWGGVIMYDEEHIPAVTAATADFAARVTDPKASILLSYNYIPSVHKTYTGLYLFYDAPTRPEGWLPGADNDFLEFFRLSPSDNARGQRGIFNVVPLAQFTPDILDVIINESSSWGKHFGEKAFMISYAVEPFLPSVFSQNTTPSAYPSDRSVGHSMLNMYYCWGNENAYHDAEFYDAIRQSAVHVRNTAVAQGQPLTDATAYPNYAIFSTPLAGMYGNNVPRLRALKERVDPTGIMGLAGGLKF